MRRINGILGIFLVILLAACEPKDQGVDPNENNQTNTGSALSSTTTAQNALEITSQMQALESLGFGRPSILSRGFGLESGGSLASGRVREDGEDEDDWDDDDYIDELLDHLESLEQELDSLELELDITESDERREELEVEIDEIIEEIDAIEDELDDYWDDDDHDYYLEDCAYASCAQEEFSENDDGSFTWVIDYGDGCNAYGDEFLKGKITETIKETGNTFSGTIVYENFGGHNWTVSGTESFSGTFEEGDEEKGTYTYEENLEVTEGDALYTVTANGTEVFSSEGFTLTGSELFMAANGDYCEMNITVPLFFKEDCGDVNVYEFVSGVEEINYREGDESGNVVIDYGDGACDNIITITENGETYQVDVETDWDDDEEDEDDFDDDESGEDEEDDEADDEADEEDDEEDEG